MTIKEIIIARVNEIQDPKLLNELLHAVDLELEIEGNQPLTNPEKKAIDEGIQDAEAGNLYSQEEARSLVKG